MLVFRFLRMFLELPLLHTRGASAARCLVLVIWCSHLQSPALFVEGDARGALLLGDAEELGDVWGSSGDEWGLGVVTVLVSGEGDLDDRTVIKGVSVQGKGKELSLLHH